MERKNCGFSLIELMIVVAILAIIATIAYPSYQEHIRKSRRADGRALLTEAAQFMERRYTENLTTGYVGATLPTTLTKAPKGGGNTHYNISLQGTPTRNAYTLQAVPAGIQSDDKCGTLTLTNTGVKGSAKTVNECWR